MDRGIVMDVLKHDDNGKFANKSDDYRRVRSIRATDRVWDDFGFLADSKKITRADLLEQWVKDGGAASKVSPIALQLLYEALTLKANAGGAIKAKIREALLFLE
jgi:hypothetical protein